MAAADGAVAPLNVIDHADGRTGMDHSAARQEQPRNLHGTRLTQRGLLWNADPDWAPLDNVRSRRELLATFLPVMAVGALDWLAWFVGGRVMRGGDLCIPPLAVALVRNRGRSLYALILCSDVAPPYIGAFPLNSFVHRSSNVCRPFIALLPLPGALVFMYFVALFIVFIGGTASAISFVHSSVRWLTSPLLLHLLLPRGLSSLLQGLAVVTCPFP